VFSFAVIFHLSLFARAEQPSPTEEPAAVTSATTGAAPVATVPRLGSAPR
jgi:hypothetical protein